MINEEDHLRMQALKSGLQLKNVFKLLDKVDSALEQKLDFAFHAGSAISPPAPRMSAPACAPPPWCTCPPLVLSEQINQIIQAVNKIGLAVRGLYGEGTEAMGNLFQVSNQTTLGETRG